MRAATAGSRVPLLRAALVGSGLAAAWVVVSLFASPSSASAEEEPSGLLGTVGSVGGTVDKAAETVVDQVVQPVTTTVTAPVQPVVEVAQPVVPEPAQPVVEAAPVVVEAAPVVVEAVADAAGDAVEAVDATATDAVAVIVETANDVTGDEPAESLIGTVDGTIGGLPIVGAVLGSDVVGGVVGPVPGVVDDTVDAVVGTVEPPEGGMLPSLPELRPGTDDPSLVEPVSSGALPTSTVAVATTEARTAAPPGSGVAAVSEPGWNHDSGPPGHTQPIGAGTWGSTSNTESSIPRGITAPAGGSGSSVSGSGGLAGSDAALAAHALDALASLVLHSVDDALPSSPVYDTDTTPD